MEEALNLGTKIIKNSKSLLTLASPKSLRNFCETKLFKRKKKGYCREKRDLRRFFFVFFFIIKSKCDIMEGCCSGMVLFGLNRDLN